MEELNEELDLTVYNKIDEILCENHYYGYATEQEVQEHIRNKKSDSDDDHAFYMKSSNGFLVWCLTGVYPNTPVDTLKGFIVDNSHDKGIDAVHIWYNGKTGAATIYIYQAKYWSKRLTSEVVTAFEDVLKMLKNPPSFEETNPTVYGELKNKKVFEALKKPNTKVLLVLYTTAELNGPAKDQWKTTKENIESDNAINAKLELRDMHYLSKYYFSKQRL